MGRVRINFNENGLGNSIFNRLMNEFRKEKGYNAEAYGGYYQRKPIWRSELSEWLSTKGFPCLMYSERNVSPITTTTAFDPIGVEMESEIATVFIITWL